MKKQYAALAALIIMTQCVQAEKTKEDILGALVSYHNLAFGKNNLFKEQIASSDLTKWNGAITEAKKFVEENSKNQLGIKDGDLTKPLSVIIKANNDLQNALKITRGVIGSSSAVKQQVDIFDRIKKEMIQVQSDLRKATFILNKEQKMLAKEILLSMALFIETTAAKAIRDTAKI